MTEPTPPSEPRAARPSGGLSVSVVMSRRTLIALVGALGGLGGFGAYKGVRADDTAGEAKQKVEVVAKKATEAKVEATEAKVEADQRYEVIKAKLDPTADVADGVANACATRAELEAVHKRIDALPLAGRRSRRGGRGRPAVVVPEAVKEPLPSPGGAP